jgi:hypothetical protein
LNQDIAGHPASADGPLIAALLELRHGHEGATAVFGGCCRPDRSALPVNISEYMHWNWLDGRPILVAFDARASIERWVEILGKP